MNKNDVVTILCTAVTFNCEVKNMCRLFSNGDSEFAQDLEQELYILLLEKDEDQLLFLYSYNQLLYYIHGLLQNQVRGKKEHSTHIYKMYNKWNEAKDKNTTDCSTYLFNDDNKVQDFEKRNELKAMNQTVMEVLQHTTENVKDGWYAAELFKMHFFEGLTYRQIEDKTAIPYTSVRNTVANLQTQIKTKFQNDDNI